MNIHLAGFFACFCQQFSVNRRASEKQMPISKEAICALLVAAIAVFASNASGQPSLEITRCTVTASPMNSDSIAFSGVLQGVDFLQASEATVAIASASLVSPRIFTFPINETTCRQGKYVASLAPEGSIISLRYSTSSGALRFRARGCDLTGLACPITVRLTLGDHFSEAIELEEDVVNGSKPCPFALLMGVQDSLETTSARFVLGKALGHDSFALSGYFSVRDVYDKSQPFVMALGNLTFTVPGSVFAAKGLVEVCTRTTSVEGAQIMARFDFRNATFRIMVRNTDLRQSGETDFALSLFGILLDGGTLSVPSPTRERSVPRPARSRPSTSSVLAHNPFSGASRRF
jgi:hypothetical protein